MREREERGERERGRKKAALDITRPLYLGLAVIGTMAMNKNSEEDEGLANQLPEDVLTCILCCLAPRFLAVSRCVCKTWCDIIDAHNLLCADLLPHSVSGIFISFNDLTLPKFFSHPTTGPTIWGNFDFLPCRGQLRDYCNGLLLIHDFVVNPATRQWVQLPPCPRPLMSFRYFIDKDYLVFDPSLHRTMSTNPNWYVETDPVIEELEWPPSPCILHVFSSRTKRWEERSFAREGEAAGTVAHMRSDWAEGPRNAVYWRGTLYIHCQTNFVMRISLSDNKTPPRVGRRRLLRRLVKRRHQLVLRERVDSPKRVVLIVAGRRRLGGIRCKSPPARAHLARKFRDVGNSSRRRALFHRQIILPYLPIHSNELEHEANMTKGKGARGKGREHADAPAVGSGRGSAGDSPNAGGVRGVATVAPGSGARSGRGVLAVGGGAAISDPAAAADGSPSSSSTAPSTLGNHGRTGAPSSMGAFPLDFSNCWDGGVGASLIPPFVCPQGCFVVFIFRLFGQKQHQGLRYLNQRVMFSSGFPSASLSQRIDHMSDEHHGPGSLLHDGEQERPVHHEIHRQSRCPCTLLHDHGRGRCSHGAELIDLYGGLVVHSFDEEPVSTGHHPGEVSALKGSSDTKLLHVLGRLELERELELRDHEPPDRNLAHRRVLPNEPGRRDDLVVEVTDCNSLAVGE
ncbi:hypothetical protein EJB05_32296 [Eragrostis curvula]|uniref:F-box domain-containing protein n=1 Tax=Eragrostis curvula TaxID=38414 RepID=A0A5J9UGE9_9POAL|nr:hypothetical protein EJB05_32296 [Eragrostis curvula]